MSFQSDSPPLHLIFSCICNILKNQNIPLYLYLLRAGVHPVQQSTDGVKSQSFHILQVLLHHHFLARAAIQTQPLHKRLKYWYVDIKYWKKMKKSQLQAKHENYHYCYFTLWKPERYKVEVAGIPLLPVCCPVRCQPSRGSSCRSQSPELQPPGGPSEGEPGPCRWPGRSGEWSFSRHTGWTRYSLKRPRRQLCHTNTVWISARWSV